MFKLHLTEIVDGWMMPRHKIWVLLLTLWACIRRPPKEFVSGQHQDVSGHSQTHLGWAIGQSGKKEADNKDPLLIYHPPQVTIYLHLYNWFLR
jgi:hypothetical protein